MGTWGPGLYQNDISEDVRSCFRDRLRRGKSAEQITQELMEQNSKELLDTDDATNFWLALADTQWEFGRLLPEVKEKALDCLVNGDGLKAWQNASHKNLAGRKRVLDNLNLKLNTAPPPEKKVSQYRLYQCPWNIGDVFFLPLDGEDAKKANLNGRYLLIEMVDKGEWHPGHQIPIVYVKLTEGTIVPTCIEEYNKLPYLRTGAEQVDFRVFPDEATTDEIARIKNLADPHGFLYEYRASIITTSKRELPNNLSYLGNFAGAPPPEKEYIPLWKINLPTFSWKELVEKVLQQYNIYL